MECFTVMREEIEGRIDPFYYKKEFREKLQRIRETKFKVVNFGDLITDLKNGVEIRTYSEKDGFRYLRVTDLGEYEINDSNPRFVKVDKIPDKIKLKENDLLISRSGSLGLVSSVTNKIKNAILSSHIFKISLDKNKINSKYLELFFRTLLGQFQFFQKNNGGIVPEINQSALKSIKIILPPPQTQNKIVQLMNKAYSSKKSKETEAQQLLDSINDYVLDELRIKLPELKNKMCFVVNYEDIEKGRIDPVGFANPQDTLSSNKFKEKSLNEVAELVKGQSITKDKIASGNYPVVAGGQSSPYSINVYNHKGNVITVSASGAYSGYVWYHQNPIFTSDCTVIKSKNEKEISTFYLYCVMKAKQRFIYNMQQGAGQPHVYSRDLSKLKIPLPPLSIQNKIAEEVKGRMQKAEQLQKEAKEELEKAKAEVEKIILG